MNKTELIKELSIRSGMKLREISEVMELFQAVVTDQIIRGEEVKLQGFGAFTPRGQGARLVRNPRTGEPVMFKSRTVVHFKTGKVLRDTINR